MFSQNDMILNLEEGNSTDDSPTGLDDCIIQPEERVYTPDLDITTLSIEQLTKSEAAYNREFSWLDFNWRVLYQALDDRNPLLERLKFLAITSSNLDEFFRKRVGGLKRQQAAGIANLILPGWTPDFQLQRIAEIVRPMVEAQSRCLLDEILPALEQHNVRLLHYDALTLDQQATMRQYYQREVYPMLTPLAVDPGHPFPYLSNLSLSLGVLLRDPRNDETRFARIKIPENRPRWIPLEDSFHFIPLEEIIHHNLDILFPGMEIMEACPFRVTRNADMARNEEEADDLLEMITEELREQRFAPMVRLEVAESMSETMCALLQTELDLELNDVYPIRGLLRLSDLFPLASINLPHLRYPRWVPLTPPRLSGLDSKLRPGEIFSIIRQGEMLVHHPYHSFAASTQQFIESAARDPQVLAIKQTLYRTSPDSPTIEALIQAAERGKQVIVLVEVKARFDEAQNIAWARTLENAGCHVAYGLVGLKIHSKLCLVVREEEQGLRTYYHIGTGNYNLKTAGLYTDLGFFSCREDLGIDLMNLFNYLTGYSHQVEYQKLLVAPVNMRERFLSLIDKEIANAIDKRPARVIAKMNGLEDRALVQKLYEAGQAGVQIDLIVRGNCRIRPNLPDLSENIRVVSVVGRFLEHSRIYYFENDGEPLYYMGSADWMRRNLNDRIEAVTPIEAPHLQQRIYQILQVALDDRITAWDMLSDGRYRQCISCPEGEAEGSQEILMESTR